jgi:hypothetical protein
VVIPQWLGCVVCENWMYHVSEIGIKMREVVKRCSVPTPSTKMSDRILSCYFHDPLSSSPDVGPPTGIIRKESLTYLKQASRKQMLTIWNPTYFLDVKFIALTTECESDILKLPTDSVSWTVLEISAGYNYMRAYSQSQNSKALSTQTFTIVMTTWLC